MEGVDYGYESPVEQGSLGQDQAMVEQLKFLFNPGEEMEEFRNYLLGRRYDALKNKFVQVCKPRMNIIGVSEIMAEVHARLSKMINLGWITDEDKLIIMKEFSEDLTNKFAEAWKRGNLYGISLEEAERVKHHLYALVDSNYSRAVNGRSYNLLIKTTKFIQETKVENKETQSKPEGGGISTFLPWRKKRFGTMGGGAY